MTTPVDLDVEPRRTRTIGDDPRPHRSLMRGGAVLSVAVAGAGAGNYAVNAVLARRLDAAAFGDASLIVTLMLVATAVAGCLQLVAARATAAGGDDASGSAALRSGLRRVAWRGGAATAVVLVVAAPLLADVLRMAGPAPLVVLAGALPFQFALAVERGRLQGELRLVAMGSTFVVEVAARAAGTLLLLPAVSGPVAAAAGITASVVAAYGAARIRSASDRGPARPPWSEIRAGAGQMAVLVAAQVLLANADLVLVKQRFDAADAGIYAAVVLLGRAVFFCSSVVTTTVFPLGAGATTASGPQVVMRRATALLFGVGLVATGGLWLAGDGVLAALFGEGYGPGARLLGPYVLATSLLAVAHFLAALDLAAGRPLRSRLLLLGAVGQVLGLLVVGWSLATVVWLQVAAMVVVLSAMGRVGRRTAVAEEPGSEAPAPGRRVLVLGTHGQGNVGDELLLSTFLDRLGPGHRYVVNSYDPAATRAAFPGLDIETFHTTGDRWALLRHLRGCDVVVFAGGTIVKELNASVGRRPQATLVMVLAVVVAARILRTPVMMSNIGVGDLPSRSGRLLARAVLRGARLVSVRDSASLAAARRLGVDRARVVRLPDAVFANTPTALAGDRLPVSPSTSGLRIALNLNRDVDDAEGWEAFLDRLADALHRVDAARRVEIVALPMQSGFKADHDRAVLEEFATTRLPGVAVRFPPVDDHHDVVAILRSADVVVAERLHTVVLSAIVGTPVVALPYSGKVAELAAQLSLHDRSFPVLEPFEPAALAAAIGRAAAGAGTESVRLRTVACGFRSELDRSFAALGRWVDDPVAVRWADLTAPARVR